MVAGRRRVSPVDRDAFGRELFDAGSAIRSISPSKSGSGQTTQQYTDALEADELARVLDAAYRRRQAQAASESATEDEGTLKFPRNPLMEAAGIEPASAAAPAERLQA